VSRRGAAWPVLVTLLALGLGAALPVRGHDDTGLCDPAADTFLFCESGRLRVALCECEGRRVRGCRRPIKRLVGALNTSIAAALRARAAGDAAGLDSGLLAAEARLTKVANRADRILGRPRVQVLCRDQADAALRAFALTMNETLGAFGSSTTTTTTVPGGGPGTTTSTTLPVSGTSCFGDLTIPTDATQVEFAVWCNEEMTRFAVVVPGGRAIVASAPPSGSACAEAATGHYVCDGTLPKNLWVRGRLTLDPAPAAGMGGDVYGWQGATGFGPFPLTGP
jgi:hypothetical protein